MSYGSAAVIAAILILLSMLPERVFAQPTTQDSVWYFGKGIKPNSYLLYNIGSYTEDTNGTLISESPKDYYLAVYFDQFDNSTNSWTGKVFANQGRMISENNFTLYLSGNPKGGSTLAVTYNYHAPCIDCITSQEAFLDFAARTTEQVFGDYQWYNYPGNSLSDSKWIGSFPRTYVNLNGTSLIAVDAGTFNCTELISEGGAGAWISKDLPLPIKGSFATSGYSVAATGRFYNIYTSYQLAQIGNDIPTVPEFPSMQTSVGILAAGFGVIIGIRKLRRSY